MSYLIFNGISSESMGIRIKSKNVYSAPKYDVTLTAIPGRDGELISPNGRFGNVGVSYTCFLPAKSIAELSDKLTKVKNWLYTEPNKYHDLTDSYDVRFMRKALFNSKLDISDECMKIGVFTISFSCKPLRYLISGLTKQTLSGAAVLTNEFNFTAKPHDTTLKNDTVTGDGFPEFVHGENHIEFGGGITSIEIIPRWVSL